jgi:hypothetical protein
MDGILMLCYARHAQLRVMWKSVIEVSRRVGTVVQINSFQKASSPNKAGLKRPTALSSAAVPGRGVVILCQIAHSGFRPRFIAEMLTNSSPPRVQGRHNRWRFVPVSLSQNSAAEFVPDVSSAGEQRTNEGYAPPTEGHRAKELLSAALANSDACRNWLANPAPNLDRAQLSIQRVIRDLNDLSQFFA